MFHYLRTKNGYTVADVEPWIRDEKFEFQGGIVNIKHFLDLYDSIPNDRKEDFKADFNEIDEMRGWFYEKFLPFDLNNVVSEENLEKTHNAIRNYFKMLAGKYDLYYGVD